MDKIKELDGIELLPHPPYSLPYRHLPIITYLGLWLIFLEVGNFRMSSIYRLQTKGIVPPRLDELAKR